jgi:hypothetical protein
MRRNVMRDAIVGELTRYGVAWREEQGGRHARIVIDAPGAPYTPIPAAATRGTAQ